jgi:subtilisin family serine protease
MSELTLMYGGSPLSLSKSPTLIGVKAKQGRAAEVEQTIEREGAVPTRQTLGGFEVVDVEKDSKSMESSLDTLRNNMNVAKGTHVYYTSDDEVPFVPTGCLYIRFRQEAPIVECERLLVHYALQIIEMRGEREPRVRITTKSPNPVKVAAALQASPWVEIAEPDLATPGQLTGFVVPNDPGIHLQWHLRNTGMVNGSSMLLKRGADARVVAGWERGSTLGTRDVVIAVIDDGFDLEHPDFASPGKIVAPWDFTRNSADPRPDFSPGYIRWSDKENMWVGDWHGTACAGVATGNANGSGILGAAPGCRFMPVRWGVDLSTGQVERWFDYVREQGAAVVSCSWSATARVFKLSCHQKIAIERCAREGRNGLGTVICFAAGNEERDINVQVGNPLLDSVNGFAIHPDVMAVSASNSMDERSHYSNFGNEISVCAPSSGAGGRGILTADVGGTFTVNGRVVDAGYSPDGFTSSFSGTSSSTPLVAGVAALLISLNPALTANQVKEIIQKTARKIGGMAAYDENGHSRYFGYGCVDAEAAVAYVQNAPTATAEPYRNGSHQWSTAQAPAY